MLLHHRLSTLWRNCRKPPCVRLCALLVTAMLAIAGCSNVNVQSAVPVSRDSIAQIRSGESDKAAVMQLLGSPAARAQSESEEVWTYNSTSANTMMVGPPGKPLQAQIYFRDDIVLRCVVTDPNAPDPVPAAKAKRAPTLLPNDCGRPVAATPKKKRG